MVRRNRRNGAPCPGRLWVKTNRVTRGVRRQEVEIRPNSPMGLAEPGESA